MKCKAHVEISTIDRRVGETSIVDIDANWLVVLLEEK